MSTEQQAALRLVEVTKRFNNNIALDRFDLEVPKGALYGLIGPNGSGKTTAIRLILRILYPDSGVVEVLGSSSGQAADERTGYLPEERGLYRHAKVGEVLIFFARLKGLKKPRRAAEQWLERLELSQHWSAKVQSLSKGMSQKVQLACALIHEPTLVILDEPFSGLDPVNAELLREIVLERRRMGMTVLFSTHDMAMAERMCDQVVMVRSGKKILDGRVDDIKQQQGSRRINVSFAEPPTGLDAIEGVIAVHSYGQEYSLELEEQAISRTIIRKLTDCGDPRSVALQRPNLHEIFISLAGQDDTSQSLDQNNLDQGAHHV